tara:strand:- start:358 stop:1020 length:663 start_codon:yes stop_codon:yes gene_type:complete
MKKLSLLTIVNPDKLNSLNHSFDNPPAIPRAKRPRSPEDTDIESTEENNRYPAKKNHRLRLPQLCAEMGKKIDSQSTLSLSDENSEDFFVSSQDNRTVESEPMVKTLLGRIADNSASWTSMTSSESPISVQDNPVFSSNFRTSSSHQASGRSQSVPLPSLGKSFNLSELDTALPSVDDGAIVPGKPFSHPNQDYFLRSIALDTNEDQFDSDYEDIACFKK